MVASLPDGKGQEGQHGNPETTSGGGGGRAGQHVKAFSGKGHTLSSGSSSFQEASGGPGSEEDSLVQALRLIVRKKVTGLKEQESILLQKVGLDRVR